MAKLRRGLEGAMADPALAIHRKALRLIGLSVLALEDYRAITDFEEKARKLEYPAIS